MTGPTTIAGCVLPGFQIGQYILRDGYGGADKMAIIHESGEGGDFDAAALEKLIADFYKEHF